MLRLAFISDIHGNAVALEAVLRDIKEKGADQIFVLGDISFRGPEPQRSLDLVRSLNCDVIKGNADEWTVRGLKSGEVPEPALEIMSKEREWIFSQMNEKSIDYLKGLPAELNLEFENVNIHAFHATPDSLFDIVLPSESDESLNEKLMKKSADIYIYGHIHRPYIRNVNGKCVINIGSVGLPFDGVNKSAYCLIDIEEGRIQTSIVRVPYDIERVVQQYEEFGYPNAEFMSSVLRTGMI